MTKTAKPLRWYTVRPGFLAFVSAAVLLGWAAFRALQPPLGSGPAGPHVPAAAFDRPWTDRPVLLVGIGDSIVTGFGAARGFGFFDRLVRNPDGDSADMVGLTLSRAFPRLTVQNVAANSTSSGDHLRSQAWMVRRAKRETLGVVVLSTGGIDLIHDYGNAKPRDEALYGARWEEAAPLIVAFRQRLDRLLDDLTDDFPGGSEIFLATIFDPTDGEGDIENVSPLLRLWKPLPPWPDGLRIHAAFNDHIRAAAAVRKNVHVVDVHATLLGHGMHCRDRRGAHYHPDDPTYWLYWNLEDPNTRGYDAIRRAFLLRMIEVLGPR